MSLCLRSFWLDLPEAGKSPENRSLAAPGNRPGDRVRHRRNDNDIERLFFARAQTGANTVAWGKEHLYRRAGFSFFARGSGQGRRAKKGLQPSR